MCILWLCLPVFFSLTRMDFDMEKDGWMDGTRYETTSHTCGEKERNRERERKKMIRACDTPTLKSLTLSLGLFLSFILFPTLLSPHPKPHLLLLLAVFSSQNIYGSEEPHMKKRERGLEIFTKIFLDVQKILGEIPQQNLSRISPWDWYFDGLGFLLVMRP